jgi:hypothetical protein
VLKRKKKGGCKSFKGLFLGEKEISVKDILSMHSLCILGIAIKTYPIPFSSSKGCFTKCKKSMVSTSTC